MKRIFTLFTLSLFLFISANAQVANHIVISQIYGGGGNAGATYTNDYVELFNPTGTDVNFTTTPYSIQYASATGTTWSNKIDLTGTIKAGKYFLVSLAAGATPSADLPTPDQVGVATGTGSVNLSATAGKLALVSSTTVLTSACPTDATIVDFVGYGTTANCSEPMAAAVAPAPAASNTTALIRIFGGCIDLNINATDFTAVAPAPRNSAVSNNCGVLPLTLTSFKGSLNSNNAVELSWTSVNEKDVASYSIERSNDGSSFSGINSLAALNTNNSAYTFTDIKPFPGANYYRLKISDKNGGAKYSSVLSFNNRKGISVYLFPNPVISNLSITHTKANKNAFIKILSADGRIIKSTTISEGAIQTSITVSELVKGSYILEFNNNGEKSISKFVKQ